jgi:Toxin co-regulated pilus biosynthesis protein Q
MSKTPNTTPNALSTLKVNGTMALLLLGASVFAYTSSAYAGTLIIKEDPALANTPAAAPGASASSDAAAARRLIMVNPNFNPNAGPGAARNGIVPPMPPLTGAPPAMNPTVPLADSLARGEAAHNAKPPALFPPSMMKPIAPPPFAPLAGTNGGAPAAAAMQPEDLSTKTYLVLRRDGNIRTTLQRWAKQSDWVFEPEHWTVREDVTLTGVSETVPMNLGADYKQAVRTLLSSTALTEQEIKPCFYSNSVLRVVYLNQRCNKSQD